MSYLTEATDQSQRRRCTVISRRLWFAVIYRRRFNGGAVASRLRFAFLADCQFTIIARAQPIDSRAGAGVHIMRCSTCRTVSYRRIWRGTYTSLATTWRRHRCRTCPTPAGHDGELTVTRRGHCLTSCGRSVVRPASSRTWTDRLTGAPEVKQ